MRGKRTGRYDMCMLENFISTQYTHTKHQNTANENKTKCVCAQSAQNLAIAERTSCNLKCAEICTTENEQKIATRVQEGYSIDKIFA